MAAIDVSIIISTYQSRAYIRECLRAVVAQRTHMTFEVIVVDNHSTDHIEELVRAEFPEVECLLLSANRGFAGSNNEAARRARGSILVFLNPDTVVEETWLAHLCAAFEDHKVGIANPKVLLYSEPTKVQNAGICLFKDGYGRDRGAIVRNHTLDFETESAYFAKPQTVHAVCGVSLAIRATLFVSLGGFEESYFLYYEDVDLSIRAQLAGFSCVYVPTAVLRHHHGGSRNSQSPTFLFYSERARLIFLLRFFPISVVAWQYLLYCCVILGTLVKAIMGRTTWRSASTRIRVLGSVGAHLWKLGKVRAHIHHDAFEKLYATYY